MVKRTKKTKAARKKALSRAKSKPRAKLKARPKVRVQPRLRARSKTGGTAKAKGRTRLVAAPARSTLSHLDQRGQARMVDVTAKGATERVATAEGRVIMIRSGERAMWPPFASASS